MVEKAQVQHRSLIYHQEVYRQRVFGIVLEAFTGRKAQQAVQHAGWMPGGFGEALGSPPGGRRQGIALARFLQHPDQRFDAGGLAGARPTGEHAHRAA